MDGESHKRGEPRQGFLLWIGLLGPPVVWLLQFQVKYSLAARMTLPSRAVVVGASLVALLAVTACGLTAWRQRRSAHASPLDTFAGKAARIHFMGTLGVMFSGLFFLVIAAQFVADFFLEAGLQ